MENEKLTPSQLGCKALRDKAVVRYYANQPICKRCKQPIPLEEGMRVADAIHKKFCNKSCAATFNNGEYPKRIRKNNEYKCTICQKSISKSYRRTHCDECILLKKMETKFGKIIFELTRGEIVDNKGAMYGHNYIRAHARNIYKKSGLPYKCFCGYDKHVQICHMTAIKDFPMETTVAIINNINNLCPLCPNHHWEFDHGFLTIDQIVEWMKPYRQK